MNPKEKLAALLKEARTFALKVKSENRDFTATEARDMEAKMAEIDQLRQHIAEGEKAANIMAGLDAMAAGDYDIVNGERVPSGVGASGKFLSFGKSWGRKAAEKIAPVGQKALATGSAVFVDTEFSATPIPAGRPATSLLDLIPARAHGQPAYRYLRQSVRSNAAAVVAEGATKPVSTYTVVPVDGQLVVVAHRSEGIPRYWFEDRPELQRFVSEELGYGLRLAVEAKVLADINATSGLQTQAFDTSALVTIRKSLTKLEAMGFTPTAIIVDPTDWEAIDLLTISDGFANKNLPYDAATRRLWGVPVALANVEEAGVAHITSAGAVAVDTDTSGVSLQWSETSNDTDWAQNLVRARCEGRFGTSVFTPLGVVKAAIAA